MHKGVADDVFSAPASRKLIACEGILAGALACWVSIQVWPYSALGSALMLAGSSVVLGQSLLVLRNLGRPILRIAAGQIEHLPVSRWSPRQIRSSDVTAIASSSGTRVVLKTATGRERILLSWLSREQREAARTAIERWVADHDRPEGEATGPEDS